MPEQILIAEDDLYQRAMLAGHLAEMDCAITVCSNAEQALTHLQETRGSREKPDLALVSTRLSTTAGGPLFRRIIQEHARVPLVLISDRGSIREAILAMREGAYDYLTKPFESLDDVGLRVSRALERARLVRENEEFRLHLKYDLEIARSVQQKFLPDSFPLPERVTFGSHYTACTEVGGDLYGALQLGEHHLGCYIFDVSGHGVSAALLTAILKISMDAHVERQGVAAAGPENTLQALNHLNPLLRSLTSPTQFATMFYCALDLEEALLHYTSAGHCPPILISPEGEASFLEPHQGLPVGIRPEGMYSQDVLPFPLGSTLLLYTDGITEALDPDGNQWGMAAALTSAGNRGGGTPQQLIDGWLADMRAHSRGLPNDDDVTVLALRFDR